MELRFQDRTVLVTGAASGIGAKIARAFCREKARAFFVDRNRKGLEQAVRGCEAYGSIITCDVSKRENVERIFNTIKHDFGELHILINSAAVSPAGNVTDMQEKDLKRIIDVNIKGYIYTTICAIPLMRKAGYGRLIYINSSSGLKASAGLSLYSASKYFNRGFAISVALEVGRYNITSNSVCPSDVYPEGELEAKSWREPSLIDISLKKEGVGALSELIRKRVQRNPMKRSCRKEDVADLVLFLASEKAGFINGQSICVNGGLIPY